MRTSRFLLLAAVALAAPAHADHALHDGALGTIVGRRLP